MKTFKLPPSSSQYLLLYISFLISCIYIVYKTWYIFFLISLYMHGFLKIRALICKIIPVNYFLNIIKSLKFYCSFVTSKKFLTSDENGQSRAAKQTCWRNRHRACIRRPRSLHRNGKLTFVCHISIGFLLNWIDLKYFWRNQYFDHKTVHSHNRLLY